MIMFFVEIDKKKTAKMGESGAHHLFFMKEKFYATDLSY